MSLLNHVACTPHIFEKNNLLENERTFERLLNALDGLSDSGILVGVCQNWLSTVNDFLNHYEDSYKKELEEVLKHLHTRQRIVNSSNAVCNQANELCWIEQAYILHNVRAFELILATQKYNQAQTLESIERHTLNKVFNNSGACVLPQSKTNMQTLLEPVLAYADISKIYDPYFKLNDQKYSDALQIICQALGCRHGKLEPGTIEIHTSVKTILNLNQAINWQAINNYQNEIKTLEERYQHSITIFIWETTERKKWHDRWLITNQCGITMGKGSDVSPWTDATWGILDYNEIPNVERKFSLNCA